MKFLKENLDDIVTLHYENLPIVYQYNHTIDYWDGRQWDQKDIEIEWDYNVDKWDILNAIESKVSQEVWDKFPDKELSDEEYEKYYEDNFDRFFTQNKQFILDYFEDDAIKDAEENYEEDVDDYFDEDLKMKFKKSINEKTDLQLTIWVDDELVTDPDGNPIYFNSYKEAADYIDEEELENAEIVRQHGKAINEGINDGWELEDSDCDILDTLDDCQRLSYEIKNCIRGGYTSCTTYQELGNYVIDLANSLKYCGEQLLDMEESVEEKLNGGDK